MALSYSLVCAVFTAFAVKMAWHGRLATTPLDVLDPDFPFLVPGDVLPLPGGQSLSVTSELVRVLAAATLLMLMAGTLVWAGAGIGLLLRRTGGRRLALGLFGLTALLGLWNLAVGVVVVVMSDGDGLEAMARPLAAVTALLVLLPAAAGLPLLGRAARASFAGAGGRASRPLLVPGLTVHFALVAGLLAAAAVTPATFGQPRLLLGPWMVTGGVARLVTFGVAVAHGGAGWLCWSRRAGAYRLSLWLNVVLTTLVAWSALAAGEAALASLAAGLMPAAGVRLAFAVAAVLGGGLVATIRASRRQLTGVPLRTG
ncbi:MAG: hypothetical protein ACE5IK_05335 [Acidobacteriota bacterium]